MSYKNGYKDSLFDTESGHCYLCKYFPDDPEIQTVRHEIMQGIANRELSKRYGLWINICTAHHDDIHRNPKDYEWLKEAAQELFECVYPCEDFLTIFGRKYI